MIVRDEEALLSRCLESVRGVVDEIVVVDTGSEDRTVAVAERFGAEVIRFDWCDDFAAARNAGIEQATGDWILVLDADEALAPDSAQALRASMALEHGGFLLPLENDLGEGRRHQTRLLRLFRRHPDIRFKGRVHEQLSESILALGLHVGDCAAVIRHDGYLPQRIAERNKHERNLALLETMRRENPSDPYVAYQYGKTLLASGCATDAVVPLRESLAVLARVEDPESYPFYSKVYLHLGSTLETSADLDGALAVLQEGIERLPDSPLLWLNYGCYARELGMAQEAFDAFERCLAMDAEGKERAAALSADMLWEDGQRQEALVRYRFAASEAGVDAFSIWLKLASRAMELGEAEEAIGAYEVVAGLNPDYLPAQLALASLNFERGAFGAAQRALEVVERLEPGRADVHFLLTACRDQAG
ncbi:MAG TPA: glycosyltransferase [Pantanalinema sp.]